MRRHRQWLWTSTEVEGIEPTNNEAERALRPAVIYRKLSFGTQSERGSRYLERILTVSEKCRRQSRVIPLFPELRTGLRDGLELAPDGAVYVVDERYRAAAMGPGGWANANLRTQLHKIIERAGLTPWPRLFQNLRSSRETELAEVFPLQVGTGWLGNSPKVALRHYLHITDEHFAKALIGTGDEAAQLPSKTAHNAARQDAANDTQADEETPENTGRSAVFSVLSGGIQIAETGLEPVTPGL